ncbi:MAG: hypothetical protein ACC652_11665 [Acidimicrobiales bacterium]
MAAIPPSGDIRLTQLAATIATMLIEREIHVAASPKEVTAYAASCPCPTALQFEPEGTGTRVYLRADIAPDDLARYVEAQLVEIICSVRDHFAAQNQKISRDA